MNRRQMLTGIAGIGATSIGGCTGILSRETRILEVTSTSNPPNYDLELTAWIEDEELHTEPIPRLHLEIKNHGEYTVEASMWGHYEVGTFARSEPIGLVTIADVERERKVDISSRGCLSIQDDQGDRTLLEHPMELEPGGTIHSTESDERYIVQSEEVDGWASCLDSGEYTFRQTYDLLREPEDSVECEFTVTVTEA